MALNHPNVTLRRFFAGLAESVFEAELGVADPPLIDYVSELLYRFVRNEAIVRIRSITGRPFSDISELLVDAESRIGDARREVHRQIGDFALFWTGLFPESLRRTPGTLAIDRYGDYCEHGKRAYRIAAELPAEPQGDAPNDVLERLSAEFEMCAYGLREVRREWERHQWERRDGGDGPGLLWVS